MAFEIKDGTGRGYIAKVDSGNRLHADSIVREEYAEAARIGSAYVVNSGYITLTGSSTTNAILFLENTGDKPLAVDRFNLSCKASTGTSETHGRFIFYRNPVAMTGGTGTSASSSNLNFGSSNILSATTQIGQNIASFSSLTAFASPVVPLQNITFIDSVAILAKGSSLGISFVTPASNSSIQVAVGLNVFEVNGD